MCVCVCASLWGVELIRCLSPRATHTSCMVFVAWNGFQLSGNTAICIVVALTLALWVCFFSLFCIRHWMSETSIGLWLDRCAVVSHTRFKRVIYSSSHFFFLIFVQSLQRIYAYKYACVIVVYHTYTQHTLAHPHILLIDAIVGVGSDASTYKRKNICSVLCMRVSWKLNTNNSHHLMNIRASRGQQTLLHKYTAIYVAASSSSDRSAHTLTHNFAHDSHKFLVLQIFLLFSWNFQIIELNLSWKRVVFYAKSYTLFTNLQ